MSISPRFLDELRSRLTLSEIIGKRVRLTRAGREFKGCCPFHNEKSPSFTVNDTKQFYHCFGCGAHGDVVGFVMQHDNLAFPQAVEMLAGMAGMEVPKPDPRMAAKAEKAKTLHGLMDETAKYFHQQLFESREGEVALKYMMERGMDRELLDRFRVGYAPNSHDALPRFIKDKGYSAAQGIEVGVLKRSSKGKDPYGFFRGRIMFPVGDQRGRVVAFGGRILPDHLRPQDRDGYTPAKYMNSPDTPLFDKGRTLYAGSLARQAVGGGQPFIITEGYMDVIACHKAGFSGAVAPMGTALTEEQIIKAWAMIPADFKAPYLCFDGDEAGRRAASRACERVLPLIKAGHSVQIVFMPEGEDPDTLIRGRGKEAFQSVLDSSLSLFDFLWFSHTAGKDLNTPELRAVIVESLENAIDRIADKQVQSHYQAQLRNKVSETFFRRKYQGRSTGRFSKQNTYSKSNSVPKLRRPVRSASDITQTIILAGIVNYPDLFDDYEEHIGRMVITDKRLDIFRQSIIAEMYELEEERSIGTPIDLEARLKKRGYEDVMNQILNPSVYVHARFIAPGQDVIHVREMFRKLMDEQGRRRGQNEKNMPLNEGVF